MSDLPAGWTVVELGDVIESMRNGLYKPADCYADDGTPCLRMYNISSGAIVWTNIKRMKLTSAEVNEYQLNPGDLLINRVNSRELVGKCALIPAGIEPCVFESKNIRVRLNASLADPPLVNYALLLYGPHHFAENNQQVVGMASISQPQIASLRMPLQPSAEQRRIVAKLDALLARVNACRARLDRIPKLLARFRQSALAAACSGRLTSDWRVTHPTPQPAAELVESFATEPPEPHLGTFEGTQRHELPPSWTYAPLGKLGKLISGGTPSTSDASFWNGSTRWVSAKDMKMDRISESQDHLTKKAIEMSGIKLIPKNALLLVVRGMILAHTLPVAITERPLTINQDLKALVPAIPELSEYLFLVLKRLGPDILFSTKEATHGTRRIETPILLNWAVPLPPLQEQAEIVRRVNQLFDLANRIESRVKQARSRINSLTQSILAKAFRGELVPTEAELAAAEGRDFESAPQLLARILSERQVAAPKRKASTIGQR